MLYLSVILLLSISQSTPAFPEKLITFLDVPLGNGNVEHISFFAYSDILADIIGTTN